MKKRKVSGKIGENNIVKDCPVLIPDENISIFTQICNAAEENGKRWEEYSNSYKKKVCESFARAAYIALK